MSLARFIARGVSSGLAKPLTVGQSAVSSALDIRASVGTSTSPTSTGTKAVTGVGFQPKVVLPFAVDTDAVGATTQTLLGIGAGTVSTSAAIAVSSRNGVTTTNTNRRHTASAIVSSLTSVGGANGIASLSSLDADGFTGNWTTVSGLANILNHIALGGADLEVSLVQCQMNGTNAAQSFAHGLSGAPTGVLFFTTWNATAPANTTTGINCGIGAWAGGNQFDAFTYSQNGVSTSNTGRRLSTSSVVSYFGSGKTLFRSMAVNSVDTTNVNVTYPVTVDNAQAYFWMLCIRGAKCQVGTFDCNGSTSPLTIATSGITPKLFLPVFVPQGVDSVGSVLNGLLLTIGACDGTNNVSCGITDENGLTTTDARRYQSSSSLAEYYAGSKAFEGTAVFSGESVIITPTINTNVIWGQGGYLCIGS